FNAINFKSIVTEIQALLGRKSELESGSIELKEIQERIETINKAIDKRDERKGEKQESKGKLKDRITQGVLLLKQNLDSIGIATEKYIDTVQDIFASLQDHVGKWNEVELPAIAFSPVTLGLVAGIKNRSTVDQLDAA